MVKYYAIARGRVRGIYTEWFGPYGAAQQVVGFPNSRYKAFSTIEEAQAFIDSESDCKFEVRSPRSDIGASKSARSAMQRSPAQRMLSFGYWIVSIAGFIAVCYSLMD